MPPKAKVTRQAILEQGLALLRSQGEEALSARALAKELGCSVQPLFHSFGSMEQLKAELARQGGTLFRERVLRETQERHIPFLGRLLVYIEVAAEEGKLFTFLKAHGEETLPPSSAGDRVDAFPGVAPSQADGLIREMELLAQGLAALTLGASSPMEEEAVVALLNALAHAYLGLRRVFLRDGAAGG